MNKYISNDKQQLMWNSIFHKLYVLHARLSNIFSTNYTSYKLILEILSGIGVQRTSNWCFDWTFVNSKFSNRKVENRQKSESLPNLFLYRRLFLEMRKFKEPTYSSYRKIPLNCSIIKTCKLFFPLQWTKVSKIKLVKSWKISTNIERKDEVVVWMAAT